MITPQYAPEPYILAWLREFTMPSDSVLDVGSGDRRYHAIGAASVATLDIWPAAQPDFLLDLEKDDLPSGEYSLILLMDLLEHLTKDRGKEILAQAVALATRAVVVMTPLKWDENLGSYQESGGFYQGNERIIHRCLWTYDEFDESWARVLLPSTQEAFFGYRLRR